MPISLTELNIGNNNFGKHIFSLAKSLPQSLIELDLYEIKMGKDALELFEIVASRLPNLKSLEASFLGGEIDTLGILKCIRKISSLTYLDFTSNILDTDCLDVIKTFTYRLPKLQQLDIQGFKSLPNYNLDIANLVQHYEKHNQNVKPHNESLFSGFMVYKYVNSEFCLSKDVMSYFIGNHHEHEVKLITSYEASIDTLD